MKSVAVRRVDRLSIVVYDATNPTDDDFSRCLEALHRHRLGLLGTRLLVATEGGEPSEEQRQRLHALIGVPVPTAILSVSRRYRALVNMKRWFRIPTQAFKMSEVNAALDFLKIPTEQYGRIKTELLEAFRELR